MADADGADGAALALLTIDLAAVAENYRQLAGKVRPAECAGVVKADAYGLGAAQVAPALWAAGCRTFFVATLDEGQALRSLIREATIYVLDGLHGAGPRRFVAAGLRPVLASLDEIDAWIDGQEDEPTAVAGLHLDTGMARLGLPQREVEVLATDKGRLGRLELGLVMSHLACADTPDHLLNDEQLNQFNRLLGLLRLPREIPRSLAASSGIFLGPSYRFDLVRPGAALYGISPLANQPNPMRQVIRLQAKILQVRRVDAGATVGYGASHRFTRPARLATVGVGYADGFLRSLSNRGAAYIGSRRAPIVGRVSMDLTVFDVSDIPEGETRPGALVDLIGPLKPIDSVAAEAGTIGYEMLTSLGRRYRRRYLPADA